MSDSAPQDGSAGNVVHPSPEKLLNVLNEMSALAHVGGWELDIATGIPTWTDETFRIFEVDRNEREEPRLPEGLSCYAPESRPIIAEAVRRAIDLGEPYDLVLELITMKGNRRWIRTTGKATRENGRTIRIGGAIADITAQKTTEQALLATYERLSLATTSGKLGIWDWNLLDNSMNWDDRMYELYGIDSTRFTGTVEAWKNGLHPDDRVRAIEECTRALEGKKDFDTTFRVCHPDGTVLHLKAHAVVIRDEGGRPVRMTGINSDITAQKNAEKQLAQSNQRLEAFWNIATHKDATIKDVCDHILESIVKMTWSRFGFFGFIAPDESAMTIHSWSGEAMQGCGMVDKPAHFPIALAGIWAEAVRQRTTLFVNDYAESHAAKRGLPQGHVPLSNLMVVPIFSGGRIVTVAAVANRGEPYTRQDERNIVAFMEAMQAILDRRKAEKEVRDREQTLRALVESTTDAVYIKDVCGRYQLINKAGAAFCGTTPDQMIGRDDAAVFSKADAAAILARDRAVMELEQARTFEEHVVDSQGEPHTFLSTKGPLRDGEGAVMGLFGIARDITEQRKVEQELQKIAKLEALGMLAGGIAHDFNNLLGGIFGYLDLARERSTEPEVKRYLDKTLGTIERARALTRQMITFAKGGAPVMKAGRLFPAVEENARFVLSGSAVALSFDVDPALRLCNFDRGQIGQVIDNLMINAQQAMPGGGTIRVKARNVTLAERQRPPLPAGEYVEIAVIDEGVGIPAEHLPKIFDPFYTTKAKGHGLGLPTCYSILKRHGGGIFVESEPGKGSTFRVYLPAVSGSSDAEAGDVVVGHSGRGTFIVMDDAVEMRDALGGMLKSFGYRVIACEEGKAAVEAFAREAGAGRPVAGMIFDLTVPGGMGGREAIVAVRRISPAVPVFVASGYADDPVMAQPAEHGFTASICKPFRKAELAQMLASYGGNEPAAHV